MVTGYRTHQRGPEIGRVNGAMFFNKQKADDGSTIRRMAAKPIPVMDFDR